MRAAKVSAGSLFFVIAISLVISVLLSSLLLLSYYHSNRLTEALQVRKSSINVQSGMTLLLNWKSSQTKNLDTTLDLFQKGTDTIRVTAFKWGLYSTGIVSAGKGRALRKRIFLYGSKPDPLVPALYLSDDDGPLSISGNTEIRGRAILPAAGIRKGYIEGVKYVKDTLVFGQVDKSSRTLPILYTESFAPFLLLLDPHRKLQTSIKYEAPGSNKDTVSFTEPTRWIKSKNPILLSHRNLLGNICIYSDKLIVVDSTALLNQVILVAPIIHIQGHFTGSIQAFASDSLVTGSSCNFTYPSALVLLKQANVREQPLLELGPNSQLKGTVVSFCPYQTLNLTAIRIHQGSKIQGFIYCNGFLQLSGSVKGAVLTDHFLYKTSATTYDNYLVDAQLNRLGLNPHFVNAAIFVPHIAKNQIVQWLN